MASVSASSSSSSSSSLNEANLEKRLLNVTNTQDSIQTLSLWCLHHKAHFAKIVQIWTKVFKTAKMSHRLALFYLANDVIQNSKRKGFLHFCETWMQSIRETIPLVTEEKIKAQMDRILTIWEERNVYDSQFISELRGLFVTCQPDEPTDVKVLADFKPQKLVDRIKKFKKLEADIELKQKQFASLKLDVCSTETLKQLKDKAHGTKFTREFEDGTTKLEEFVQILQRRVKERKALIDILEDGSVFYDTQRKEAKIVANAYKNFGSRVKNLQEKLEEKLPNLSSPVPSPSFDAPSPEDSSVEGSPPRTVGIDNTDAVDMEMSDEELGINTNLQDKDDVSSLSSAPSPDGSPVGLSVSPTPSFVPVAAKSFTPHSKAPATSLLERLRKTSAAPVNAQSQSQSSTPKPAASSLDIRLSNLMHSIPNFASNLFGGHPLVDAIKIPPTNAAAMAQDGCATPLKDEESGTGSATPLQDENREIKANAKNTPPKIVQATSIIDNLIQKLTATPLTALPPPQPKHLPANQQQQQQQQQQQAMHLQQHPTLNVALEPKLQKYPLPSLPSEIDDIVMPLDMPPSFCDLLTPAMLRAMESKQSFGAHAEFPSANGDEKGETTIGHMMPTGESVYRRNSNIVQLTPSPRASPKFDAKPEQQQQQKQQQQQQPCWVVNNQGIPVVKSNTTIKNVPLLAPPPPPPPPLPAVSEEPKLILPNRAVGESVFFPTKLNPPKKSTITINLALKNTKTSAADSQAAAGTSTLATAAVGELKAPPPPSSSSSLTTTHTPKIPNSLNARTIASSKSVGAGGDDGTDMGSSKAKDSKNEPIYSKIETLDSSSTRDAYDFWAQVVASDPNAATVVVPPPPITSWTVEAQQQQQQQHSTNRLQQADFPQRHAHHPPPTQQQRFLGPFDTAIRGPAAQWPVTGVRNPNWRSPGGPLPKRAMLMPNVPRARWNYYHPNY